MRTGTVTDKHEPTSSLTLSVDDDGEQKTIKAVVATQLFDSVEVGMSLELPPDLNHPTARASGWLRWSF